MGLIRLLATLWLLLAATAAYGQVVVEGVRMWPAPDNTRLVFDLNGPIDHRLFTLAGPERVVIDIKGAGLDKPFTGLDFSQTLLQRIRTGTRNDGRDLRIVLDLERKARPKSFVLRPNDQYGHRLVIDLHEVGERAAEPVAVKSLPSGAAREVVIAIDAGHGGDDPGASGPGRTREKDVVLALARRLEALVRREPGMRPVMIRDGDYFISLNKRVEKARRHNADLFVSIHADAFSDRRVDGASVYTLSLRGASSEHARLLAKSENASDLVGGVSLDDKDDVLASVLLDLSQTATLEASNEIAGRIITRLGGVTSLHKRSVEQAGFRVLKAPDIPSILVETAFISNPSEERRLKDPRHQERMARALMDGIRDYFQRNPPPGTLLAAKARRHVIARGDTLSEIAQKYRVSTESLRAFNELQGNVLHAGAVLRIPPGGG